jgi:NosR/NirI family transcriptional regulator, nitrous oxide reductase regulator
MKKIKNISAFLLFVLILIQSFDICAINRFPKPEFESGHVIPKTITPDARFNFLEFLDVAVLIFALSLVTWLLIKKRSRRGIFLASLFSILYFGFYRQGCVCPVGSLQNVALVLFKPGYVIPLTALLFFVIPLIFTIFFGRTFCAGVCPLGAIQDLVAFRPVEIKIWLGKTLGIIPFIYLGLAILYAATGTDFIICRYDPFVGLYRLNGHFFMLVLGALFLLIGVVIARPYCRFLCPYGALLNFISRFSCNHVTITPSACINCKLCENSCPYGAIKKPVPLKEKEKTSVIVKRYLLFSFLIPVLIVTGGYIASNFHENLAMVNGKVKLAKEVMNNTNYGVEGKEALEITGFRSSGQSEEKMYSDAAAILKEFYRGSWIFGGFVGLVFGLTLLSLTIFKYQTGYSIDKATCLSCGICLGYCPVKSEKEI